MIRKEGMLASLQAQVTSPLIPKKRRFFRFLGIFVFLLEFLIASAILFPKPIPSLV